MAQVRLSCDYKGAWDEIQGFQNCAIRAPPIPLSPGARIGTWPVREPTLRWVDIMFRRGAGFKPAPAGDLFLYYLLFICGFGLRCRLRSSRVGFAIGRQDGGLFSPAGAELLRYLSHIPSLESRQGEFGLGGLARTVGTGNGGAAVGAAAADLRHV